ncbi:cytidine deaminase [Corynebacterium variabile]|uniref:cytidine deaminase n=1 Tax=Corynebacterium variabile TaxID=1727 RepID=UPI003A94AA26
MSAAPPAAQPAPSDATLLDLARDAATRAYAPYSQFRVGAALLLSDGSVVTGCNAENASYGLAMCAERVAVGRAVADGLLGAGDAAGARIEVAAVVGLGAAPCFPCGACRQVLHEFGCGRVVVEGGEDATDTAPLSLPFTELLPHAFGPGDL